jgi:hypothetical protein
MVDTFSNTGSILVNPQTGNDRTGTAISTNILIKVGPLAVGAVQQMTISEDRRVVTVDEVGTDGHIDSVPNASTNITGTIKRIRFDRMRITEALGCGYLHIASQRIPFDIDIYDNWNGDGSNAIVSTVSNVWFTRIDYQYQASDWLITDDVNWVAETIYSTLNGSNAATGGDRGSSILRLDTIERSTDVGNRRGALDAPGLITDYFTNV